MNIRRFTTVTERKMNTPSMDNASIKIVTKGFISLSAPIGLVSMTSGDDQAQKVSPIIKNITVRITVIIVDRTISFLSGTSSLTVVNTDLENRGSMIYS